MTIILDNTLQLTATMTNNDMRTAIVRWAHGDFLNRGDTCQALLNVLERSDKETELLNVCARNDITTDTFEEFLDNALQADRLANVFDVELEKVSDLITELGRLFEDLYDEYEVDHVPFDRMKILAALKQHTKPKGKTSK